MSSTDSQTTEGFAAKKKLSFDKKVILGSVTNAAKDPNMLLNNMWFWFSAFCVIIAFIRFGVTFSHLRAGGTGQALKSALVSFFVCTRQS